MTRTEEQEISAVSGRLPGNLGELAYMGLCFRRVMKQYRHLLFHDMVSHRSSLGLLFTDLSGESHNLAEIFYFYTCPHFLLEQLRET